MRKKINKNEKYQRMHSVSGGRTPSYAAFEKKIRERLIETTREFNCSRNMVINIALADFLSVEIEEKL